MLAEGVRTRASVAITRNLVPQLCEDGILIPEKVTVCACLYDPSTEFQFSPSEATVEESQRVRVDLGLCVQKYGLMLQTTVTVFQSNALSEYESGITYPHILHDLDGSNFPGELEFNYLLGRKPGFRYRWSS